MPTRILLCGILSVLMSLSVRFLPAAVVAYGPGIANLQYLLLQQSMSPGDLGLTRESFDRSVWASAKPYMDGPLSQLIDDVPELRGLDATQDQQPLADILKNTGDRSLDLLKRTQNVICHENVVTKLQRRGRSWRQQYEYLVIRHEAAGKVTLEEYRTDKAKSGTAPLTRGTANAWVLFHPGNLAESRFRYLGRQLVEGHRTFVLAFAQIPEKVNSPGLVSFEGTQVAVLFQGIAWIDESDFRIVRLRKDLLAPRPDIYLRALSEEVLFAEVRVPEAAESLWLPREAKTTWDSKGEVVEQIHQYSRFRLYRSKSKIVM